MKKYFGLLILSLLLFGACKKEEEKSEPEIFNGQAVAKINGEEFDFRPAMTSSYGKENVFTIGFVYFVNGDVRRKGLTFSFLKGNLLTQSVYPFDINNQDSLQSSFFTNLYDGDVAGNFYWLNENDDIEDYFRLTKFDETTGEVEGEFQASFYVDTATIFDINSPDTIVITDGYFETIILK